MDHSIKDEIEHMKNVLDNMMIDDNSHENGVLPLIVCIDLKIREKHCKYSFLPKTNGDSEPGKVTFQDILGVEGKTLKVTFENLDNLQLKVIIKEQNMSFPYEEKRCFKKIYNIKGVNEGKKISILEDTGIHRLKVRIKSSNKDERLFEKASGSFNQGKSSRMNSGSGSKAKQNTRRKEKEDDDASGIDDSEMKSDEEKIQSSDEESDEQVGNTKETKRKSKIETVGSIWNEEEPTSKVRSTAFSSVRKEDMFVNHEHASSDKMEISTVNASGKGRQKAKAQRLYSIQMGNPDEIDQEKNELYEADNLDDIKRLTKVSSVKTISLPVHVEVSIEKSQDKHRVIGEANLLRAKDGKPGSLRFYDNSSGENPKIWIEFWEVEHGSTKFMIVVSERTYEDEYSYAEEIHREYVIDINPVLKKEASIKIHVLGDIYIFLRPTRV